MVDVRGTASGRAARSSCRRRASIGPKHADPAGASERFVRRLLSWSASLLRCGLLRGCWRAFLAAGFLGRRPCAGAGGEALARSRRGRRCRRMRPRRQPKRTARRPNMPPAVLGHLARAAAAGGRGRISVDMNVAEIGRHRREHAASRARRRAGDRPGATLSIGPLSCCDHRVGGLDACGSSAA